MDERMQIITFLLQQCDAKNFIITESQKTISELQKKLADQEAAASGAAASG